MAEIQLLHFEIKYMIKLLEKEQVPVRMQTTAQYLKEKLLEKAPYYRLYTK